MNDQQPDSEKQRGGRSRRHWLALLGVLLPFLSIVGGELSGSAQSGRSVVWERYDVTIDLQTDGSYHVTERQVVDFQGGPWSTAFADIPMGRIDAIENVVVSEVIGGRTVRFEKSDCCGSYVSAGEYIWGREGGYTAIRWGFERADDETRIFLLEYDVIGALRVYPDNVPPVQQIWWTAIGTEVTEIAPVRASTVTINLPVAVDPLDVVLSQDDVTVDPAAVASYTTEGRTWTWTKQHLREGDSFIVRLEFPPIVQASPPRWQQADDERRRRQEEAEERAALLNAMFLGAGLLGLVGGGIGIYGLWYLRGRDPHVGLIADFLPAPPDGLPPGAAGALVDEVVHERDIVATLVDLSRRNVIAMSETRASGLGSDVTVTLVDPAAAIAPFEREALNAIFNWKLQEGETTTLWRASDAFARSAPGVRSLLYDELVRRGYFTSSPEETRTNWRNRALRLMIWLPILGLFVWFVFLRDSGWFWVPLGAAVLLSLAIYLLSGALPKKTVAGAEAAARWRAFRRYLEGIEKYEKVGDRQHLFDNYLPYAIAFGLEERWMSAFINAGAPAPRWFAPVWRGDPSAGDEPSRRRRDDREFDWTTVTGRSWWDVTGGDRAGESRGEGDDGGFNLPSLPDWQGTSDHAGRALSSASNGLMSMFNTAGRALSSMAEAAAESDWGSSSGGSRRSGGTRSRSSFGGGGRRGGSSGGGRRGFG